MKEKYVNLFRIAESRIVQINAIRHLESINEWETAANLWMEIGETEHGNACMMIHESIVNGNIYRTRVQKYMDWYNETIHAGIMTCTEALKIISPKLQEEYNNVFNPDSVQHKSSEDDEPF